MKFEYTVNDKGRVITTTRLADHVVSALQPVVDASLRLLGSDKAYDLSKADVAIGSLTGRGESSIRPGGDIQLTTPGEGPGSYAATLKAIVHEIGHGIQVTAAGYDAVIEQNTREIRQLGRDRAYETPGTIENAAVRFQQDVFRNARKLGL